MKNNNNSKASSLVQNELLQEVHYLRQCAEWTTARLLLSDNQAIAIRHELEQKRRGFSLMADLAVTLGQGADYQSVFISTSQRINVALNMQRTAVLIPDEEGKFKAAVLQGYTAEEKELIAAYPIEVDDELLAPLHPVLITCEDDVARLASFREALALPYLISSPVVLNNEIVALLVTGRLIEQPPFSPRLGRSDVETVQTVATYLTVMLTEQRLKHAENLANHDPLTQLPNLRKTSVGLHKAIAMARREGFIIATMFIDLDSFKAVNDSYGHATGDIVLRKVAERLTGCLRETDLVGRIGGDEFVVVLSRIKHADDASVVASKIIKTLAEPMDVNGIICQIGASIGIAIYPDHGDDKATLLKAADEAMYAVKNKGKNTFCYAGASKISDMIQVTDIPSV